jgi:hypothetical protein
MEWRTTSPGTAAAAAGEGRGAASVVVRPAAGQEPLSRQLEPAGELALRQSTSVPATAVLT